MFAWHFHLPWIMLIRWQHSTWPMRSGEMVMLLIHATPFISLFISSVLLAHFIKSRHNTGNKLHLKWNENWNVCESIPFESFYECASLAQIKSFASMKMKVNLSHKQYHLSMPCYSYPAGFVDQPAIPIELSYHVNKLIWPSISMNMYVC